ncbi:MAG: hypothetical protein ABI549_06750 [Flavobacterium sp.]|uniref:hypothetical protein n=1 Tax=Flavobacterium sp. TaxID=239 RepID=UPI0032645FB3
MKKLKIVLLFISTLFIVSCESNTYQEVSEVVINPTYVKDIAPVCNAECVACHSAGGQYPELDTYAAVKDAVTNGNFLCRINASCGSVMPPSGAMPQATIDVIKLWSTNGYLNN